MHLDKEKILKWLTFAICGIVVTLLTIVLISRCGTKSEVNATVAFPDIKVYIRGEIKSPGLYEIAADIRLCELIELAGGATENADLQRLNLAAFLTDGTTVKIPAVGEEPDPEIAQQEYTKYEVDNTPEQTVSAASADKITSGTININTASASELMRLPGVGQTTANKIISYRETNGKFLAIEEIMNVSGIGEKKFESMKQFLSVE